MWRDQAIPFEINGDYDASQNVWILKKRHTGKIAHVLFFVFCPG